MVFPFFSDHKPVEDNFCCPPVSVDLTQTFEVPSMDCSHDALHRCQHCSSRNTQDSFKGNCHISTGQSTFCGLGSNFVSLHFIWICRCVFGEDFAIRKDPILDSKCSDVYLRYFSWIFGHDFQGWFWNSWQRSLLWVWPGGLVNSLFCFCWRYLGVPSFKACWLSDQRFCNFMCYCLIKPYFCAHVWFSAHQNVPIGRHICYYGGCALWLLIWFWGKNQEENVCK